MKNNELVKEVARLQDLLAKHGICEDCGELYNHHIDEPFASCGCKQAEWYELTPHMKQVLELKAERDALAARIQTAERVEKIFREMPELKFDDCLKLFADEIRNVQAEAGRRGYLEAALNFDPDYDAWWSAEQYAATVRQGGAE